MTIRKTTAGDLDQLAALFAEASRTIAALGIDQWQNGYPSRESAEQDMAADASYCVEENGIVCGTFALIRTGDPPYDMIEGGHWLTGDENRSYLTVHRMAVAVSHRGQGISAAMLDYAAEEAKRAGQLSLRMDTHRGNIVMRKMLEKYGFSPCGVIYLANGDPRVAYEKRV